MSKNNENYDQLLGDLLECKNELNTLKSALNSVNDLFFILDRKQKHTFISGNLLHRANLTESYFIGKTARDIFGENKLTSIHEEANLQALSGKPITYEWDFDTNNEPQSYRTSLSPIYGPEREIVGIVGIARNISEEKQLLQNIKTKEENLRITLNSIGDAVIITDEKGLIIQMNPIAEDLTGWKEEEAIDKPLAAIFHILNARTKERLENPIEKVLKSGKVIGLANHTMLISRDGSHYQIADSAAPITDSDGNVLGVILVFRDVSNEYQMQENLKESQQKLLDAQYISRIGDFTWDLKTDNITWSKGMRRLLKYGEDEAIDYAKVNNDIHHPEDLEKVTQWLRQGIDSGQTRLEPNEYRLICKDGEIIYVHTEAKVKYKDGKPDIVFGTCHDITQRKLTEQALISSERKFSTLFESMMEIVVLYELVVDNKGEPVNYKIIDCNKAFCNTFKISKEDALGKTITELFDYNSPPCLKEFAQVALTGKPYQLKGHYKPLNKHLSISAVSPQKGQFATISSDITAQKQIENILEIERDLSIELNKVSGLKQALEVSLDFTIKVSGLDCGGIYIIDEDKEEINLLTHQGLSDDFIRAGSHYTFESENAQYILKGDPIYIHYEELKLVLSSVQKQEGLKTIAILPITTGDKTIGSLNIASHTSETITSHQKIALESMVSKIGITFARIIEQEKRINLTKEYQETMQGLDHHVFRHIKDKDGEYICVFSEGKIAEKFAITTKHIRGIRLNQLFSPENYNKVKSSYDKAFAGESVEFETQMKEVFFRTKLSPFRYDPTGNVIEIIGYSEDFTQRKRAEEELQKEKQFTELALDSQVDTFFLFDPYNGKAIRWNKSFAEISGYTNDEISSMKVPDSYYSSTDIAKANQLIQKVMENKTATVELGLICKSGEIIPTEYKVSLIKDENGNPKYLISIGRDITERKRMEQFLKESENRYRTLVKESPLAIEIYDKHGYLIETNPSWEDMWQLDPAPYYGKRNILGSGDLEKLGLEEYFTQAYQGETITLPDFEFNPAQFGLPGRKRWISSKLYAIKDESSKIQNVIHLIEDISKRKKAEIEIIKAKEMAEESDKLKSAFLANMSHEIRTPLNGIIGFVDLLLMSSELTQKHRDYLKFIKKNGKLLLSLINDILDISRIEAEQVKINLTPISISSLFLNIKTLAATLLTKNKANIDFQMVYPENINDKIIGDATKLTQILNNLISNAVKFTNAGIIQCGASLKNNNTLEFFVKDTGMGIPKKKWDDIFSPFHQGDEQITIKYGGTGLGLAISKKLVELMGGKIWLNSIENIGTTFYFTIPYIPAENTETENRKPLYSIPIKTSATILIAEDNVMNQKVVEQMIQKIGYNVIIAEDGIQVMEWYHNKKNIDLILLDIRMPNMDGLEVARQIRSIEEKQNKPRLPIIALTAAALDEDRIKGLEAGFDDYLAKPLEMETLIAILKKYLG